MPSDDTTGQVPGQTPPADDQPAPTPNDGEQFDEARARALIEKLRPFERQASRLERELAAERAKVAEFEKAKLTETERLQQERDEALARTKAAEARAQERAIRADVVTAAAKLNIVDPDAAYKLLDASQIELDANDDPKNVEKLLADLVKAKPYLVGQTASTSPMNPQRGTADVAETDEQRRNRLYGSRASIFDPAQAAQRGGGVLFRNPTQ